MVGVNLNFAFNADFRFFIIFLSSIENMVLTKKQAECILSKFLNKENGLNDVLQMTLHPMIHGE